MESNEVRRRQAGADAASGTSNKDAPVPSAATSNKRTMFPKSKRPKQGLNYFIHAAGFTIYFLSACICLHIVQLFGAPLYFFNKDYFYAWNAMMKQFFGVTITFMTQVFCPTPLHVTGDASVSAQLKRWPEGQLKCEFPERMILIANHQIYVEWIYLWHIAYTAEQHGHIYIILKESLKYVPLIGPAMMLFRFIFMARNWTKDKPRVQYRVQKLNSSHQGPLSGTEGELDPMWLLIFPEGTNMSNNGRKASAKWAEKNGWPDLRHALLPRSTGLLFCLQELHTTVEYIYDCTIGYKGIPSGQWGQDIYTLGNVYLAGHSPDSVHMHWRRFKISDIPIKDDKEFEAWIRQRWIEKDGLLEYFEKNGEFPTEDAAPQEEPQTEPRLPIRTEIMTRSPLEGGSPYLPFLGLFYSLIWVRRGVMKVFGRK